ncbi:hypothetical protein [Xanthocytophaga agilis]|uniref:Uncharacterized protein n=1 Tax=Xanthocytophaga agilis TaxID=3048010 RepID=A0AAE3R1Q6_9BACT|nr:hypothetical protein [Xanthocytophaga agilis]MDJ1499283.1 hypothetical protein [Xanthocytophaga agilis]
MIQLQYKSRNTIDGLLLFYLLLILSIITFLFLRKYVDLTQLVIYNTLILLISFLAPYSLIKIENNRIIVKKTFLGICYTRIEEDFQAILCKEESIYFIGNTTKIKLENHYGYGYYWGGYPDSMLIIDKNTTTVLGSPTIYQDFKKTLVAEMQKTEHSFMK